MNREICGVALDTIKEKQKHYFKNSFSFLNLIKKKIYTYKLLHDFQIELIQISTTRWLSETVRGKDSQKGKKKNLKTPREGLFTYNASLVTLTSNFSSGSNNEYCL